MICNIYYTIIKWHVLCMCMCLHFSVFHQRDQDFSPPSSVTPFSNPLEDNLFVFVGTLYRCFYPSWKMNTQHFNNQTFPHIYRHTCQDKLHTLSTTRTLKSLRSLNIKWCRLETQVPLHSFQPSCIFARHPELATLCFIIRASRAACLINCPLSLLSGKSGYHED